MTINSTKTVLVTGGTGFIGELLCRELLAQGYTVWQYTRRKASATQAATEPNVHSIQSLQSLPNTFTPHLLINLAGEPIADKRWTPARKKLLWESRVGVTKKLLEIFADRPAPPVVISGSAIGFYGPHQDEDLNESSSAVNSFSHDLCSSWEAEAQKFSTLGSRVCLLRTGVVLGRGGGTLARLLPLFKCGLGGPMGNGQQWMSWIHREDLVRLILFLVDREDITGPVNATAPAPVRNVEFSKILGSVLHRPTFLPTPGFMLKLVFGQMADELLLSGQKVIPEKAVKFGFTFNYPDLFSALQECAKN